MTSDSIYYMSIIVASAAFLKISKYVSRPTPPPPITPDQRTERDRQHYALMRITHRLQLAARGITFEQWIKEELEDAAKGFYNEQDLVTPNSK